MPELQIKLFGGFHVLNGDATPIRFATQKVRALLAYLSVEAQTAHSREKLMALFWPEQSQTSANNNLRQTLLRLRTTLPTNTLILRDNEIQLNPSADYSLDVNHFLQYVGESTRRGRIVQSAEATGVPLLEAAVALYRGDFLAHFSLPDSPTFEEWALFKREWLRGETLGLLHQLTLIYEQTGRYEDAVHKAHRQIEIDSLREVAYQQLMRNLAMAGRRNEALAQYELCQRILAQELHVAPAPETTQLAQQIRVNEITPNRNAESHEERRQLIHQPAREAFAPTAHFNVPTPLTPLIGREDELAHLAALLVEPTVRLLTIVGAGGMGKTHLAVEVAGRQRAHFTHGVAFITLAPLQSIDAVVSALATGLHYSFHSNGEPLHQLLDYLREKELLLVFDNFEHLLSACPLVVELLENAAGLKCLVTSRVALGVVGEQLFALDGVALPPPDLKPTARLDQYGAVQLFVQSARRVTPTFQLDLQLQPTVLAICRHVQGMPLGILLATAWLKMLTPAELLAQLTADADQPTQKQFNFLETNWPGLDERQRSLRRVFDRSWHLLNEREQRAFRRIAIFRDGFDLAAAQAVCNITLHDLLALIDHSLLRRMTTGRFELHELVRQYALEKFAEVAQGDATPDQHALYFANCLLRYSANFRHTGELEAVTTLKADSENLRVAWRWALLNAQWELLDQMVSPLGLFYERSGRGHEGETLFTQAAAHFSRLAETHSLTELTRFLWAHCVVWQSNFRSANARATEVDKLHQQAQALLDQLQASINHGVPRVQAFLLLLRAERAQNLDVALAEALSWESIRIYQELGDQPRRADAMATLNQILYWRHGAAADRTTIHEALQIYRTLGDQRGLAKGLNGLRVFAQDEGRFDDAETIALEILQLLETVGNPSEIAMNLWLLGQTQVLNAKFFEAKQTLGQALTIWQDLGTRAVYAVTLDEYCHARLHLGEYIGIAQDLQRSAAITHEFDDKHELALVYSVFGMIELVEHKLLASRQSYQKGCENSRGYAVSALIYNLVLLNYTESALGDYATTRKTLLEALLLIRQVNYHFAGWIAIGGYARLLAAIGEVEEAVTMYALACNFGHIRHSRWFADVAGNYITDSAKALPSATVAEAKRRGQALDFRTTIDRLIDELQHA